MILLRTFMIKFCYDIVQSLYKLLQCCCDVHLVINYSSQQFNCCIHSTEKTNTLC